MYIELYLLDNAVMDFIILRVAKSLCASGASLGRCAAWSAAGALYATAALMCAPLTHTAIRAASCAAMAFAIYDGGGTRRYAGCLIAFLAASFMVGGMSFCVACLAGVGGLRSISLAAAVISAVLASLLPRTVRGIVARREAGRGKLSIVHGGRRYEMPAMIDTGNTLTEPISNMPVIVACVDELRPLADIPIPASTVTGRAVLYALRPDSASFDGARLEALLCISQNPLDSALIPASAVQAAINTAK